MRFTIGGLLLAVALAALGCAGLTTPNYFLGSSIATLSVVMFVVMGIRAVGLTGKKRAAAIAFAAVGGGYLLFVECGWFRTASVFLITNYPLAALAESRNVYPVNTPIYATQNVAYGVIGPPGSVANGAGPNQPTPSMIELLSMLAQSSGITPLTQFFLIGHCVWSWVFALLAGWFAGSQYQRRVSAAI
jgi:hypothetical protein